MIALFVAVASAAEAAINLPVNSVGTKHLKIGATGGDRRSPHARALNRAVASIPAGARTLIRPYGVFRRKQTAADEAGNRYLGTPLSPHIIGSLTRLVAALPRDRRIFLVVVGDDGTYSFWQTGPPPNLQYGVLATGPSTGLWPTPSFSSTIPGHTTFEALVPDRVARVHWSWSRRGTRPPLTINIPTPSNFAAATVPSKCGEFPERATAYSASGKVIANTGTS